MHSLHRDGNCGEVCERGECCCRLKDGNSETVITDREEFAVNGVVHMSQLFSCHQDKLTVRI